MVGIAGRSGLRWHCCSIRLTASFEGGKLKRQTIRAEKTAAEFVHASPRRRKALVEPRARGRREFEQRAYGLGMATLKAGHR